MFKFILIPQTSTCPFLNKELMEQAGPELCQAQNQLGYQGLSTFWIAVYIGVLAWKLLFRLGLVGV